MNRINNFLYMYNIKNTEENFKKLREVIEKRNYIIYRKVWYMIHKRNYIIYRKVWYMIHNCQIIEEDSTGITVEIDLLEHHKLLEDLMNSFFTKKNSARKVEKKLDTLILWEIHS